MSQIQNSTLHNYVQPAVLIAAAFAASSSRFIEYFPGASAGGLRIQGIVGATFALASQKWAVEDETPYQSLLRATTSFATGGLVSLAITKGLQGRVELSPSAALRLVAVQFVYGVVISLSSAYTTETTEPLPPPPPPKPTLQEHYDLYSRDEEKWVALSSDARAQLATQFFEKGLPLQEVPHLYMHLGKSTRLSLIEQLIQKEELVTHRGFLKAMVRDSECLEILHEFFLSNPLELYPLGKNTYEPFIQAVEENSLAPIRKGEKATVEDIQKCSNTSVTMYHAKFQLFPQFWNRRHEGYQDAFNARFETLGLQRL